MLPHNTVTQTIATPAIYTEIIETLPYSSRNNNTSITTSRLHHHFLLCSLNAERFDANYITTIITRRPQHSRCIYIYIYINVETHLSLPLVFVLPTHNIPTTSTSTKQLSYVNRITRTDEDA